MSYKSYSKSKIFAYKFSTADTLEMNPFEDYDLDQFPEQYKILEKSWPYLSMKHNITNERKWVNVFDIEREGIANAFYDTDHTFCPKRTPPE